MNHIEQRMVVLFSRKDSIYKKLGLDCYDITRDALQYSGTSVAICHPPCRLWGQLKQFSTAPACERLHTLFALTHIEKFGGILEHPNRSGIWKIITADPTRYTGVILKVSLSWFGFPAEKITRVYIKGVSLSEIPTHPLSLDAITHVMGTTNRLGRSELKKSMRDQTPRPMAEWLISIANQIEIKTRATGDCK